MAWGLFFMVLGGAVIWCCFINADWFFKLVKTGGLGRTGARILYGAVGLMLIVFSILIFMEQ